MNKTLATLAFATLSVFAGSTFASNAACDAQATEKKLAGAAKTRANEAAAIQLKRM